MVVTITIWAILAMIIMMAILIIPSVNGDFAVEIDGKASLIGTVIVIGLLVGGLICGCAVCTHYLLNQ